MKLNRLLLTTTVLLISLNIKAQDLIYRKNGDIVKAKIINATDRNLSYKLYEQIENTTYFINNELIDSIIYQNGEKETFLGKPLLVPTQTTNPDRGYNHHLIGADLAALLLYKNLMFSYEFLPGKTHIGFKVVYAKNQKPIHYYYYENPSFNRFSDWSTRLGINYYLFPQSTFRFGTGVHYIFGSMTTEDYVLNEDYTSYTYIKESNNIHATVLSLFGFYNITNNLAFNIGADVFLRSKPKSTTAIRCEILLNF